MSKFWHYRFFGTKGILNKTLWYYCLASEILKKHKSIYNRQADVSVMNFCLNTQLSTRYNFTVASAGKSIAMANSVRVAAAQMTSVNNLAVNFATCSRLVKVCTSCSYILFLHSNLIFMYTCQVLLRIFTVLVC